MYIHTQMHTVCDPSHVEDERDATAHQEIPTERPVQNTVPPQSSEVSVNNTFIACVTFFAEERIAKMGVVVM